MDIVKTAALRVGQLLPSKAIRVSLCQDGRMHLDGQKPLHGSTNQILTFLFSGIIGSALPGAIYVSQKIMFKEHSLDQTRLIYPHIEVIRDMDRDKYLLQTDLLWGQTVIAQGQAVILYTPNHE